MKNPVWMIYELIYMLEAEKRDCCPTTEELYIDAKIEAYKHCLEILGEDILGSEE